MKAKGDIERAKLGNVLHNQVQPLVQNLELNIGESFRSILGWRPMIYGHTETRRSGYHTIILNIVTSIVRLLSN